MTRAPSGKINKTSDKEQKREKKFYSLGWAKRLKRVFNIDIQTCQECGGRIKIISNIHNQQVIKRIFTHLGENPKIPKLSSPRGPPEGDESFVII